MLLALAGLALACGLAGCRRKPEYQPPRSSSGSAGAHAQELFESAELNLNRLEEYDSAAIMHDIRDRLNQWLRTQRPDTHWKPDALLATLPEPLRPPELVKGLAELALVETDMMYFSECVWLRNAARTVAAGEVDDLAIATRLFDWTVRNIQLVPIVQDGEPRPPYEPWVSMITGRGTAAERARVFIGLARQQRIDVVMLALAPTEEGGQPRPWLTAVAAGGQLYLFDPSLGLPIPGPGGQGVATLSQLQADDGLLRALDLDDQHPYPIRGEDLGGLVALIDASPPALSARMQMIEARMSGDQKIMLTANTRRIAKQLRGNSGVSDVRLWDLPFAALMTTRNAAARIRLQREMLSFHVVPTLWKARLYYFRGNYTGEHQEPGELSANRLYQLARPSAADLERSKDMLKPEELASLEATRQAASYWLGLVAYERGEYATAEDYFLKRSLEVWPEGTWAQGARYNLGRSYEARQMWEQAVAAYEQCGDSPQRHGDLLRARWLKKRYLAGPADGEAPQSPPQTPPAAPADNAGNSTEAPAGSEPAGSESAAGGEQAEAAAGAPRGD